MCNNHDRIKGLNSFTSIMFFFPSLLFSKVRNLLVIFSPFSFQNYRKINTFWMISLQDHVIIPNIYFLDTSHCIELILQLSVLLTKNKKIKLSVVKCDECSMLQLSAVMTWTVWISVYLCHQFSKRNGWGLTVAYLKTRAYRWPINWMARFASCRLFAPNVNTRADNFC